MTIIGFDVSKTELVGVRINRRSDVLETYVFPNTHDAITQFLDTVGSENVLIGSEATGEYHNVLALSCLERGIPFRVLNPIVTKQFTKATVRKRKTDLSDAHVIAKCLLQGEGELADASCFDVTKPILRTAAELSRLSVAVRHMERRFQEHFSDEEWIQEELRQIHERIEQSIRNVRRHGIERTNPTLQKLLSSVPGIGETLASTVIAEIGDVRRFHNARALVAFAGLDPKVRQSGYTLKRNTRLTKRGSPFLRRALYIAASIAQRCDPELKAYFEKKKNEGKRYKEATVANARHVLFRIYAVWKRGTPFMPVIHNKPLAS